MQVDLATMTGNVAQAIAEPSDWNATLRGVHHALRPGGHLVFETRDPAKRAWHEWNRAASYKVTEIEGVGPVESWVQVIDVQRAAGDVPLDGDVRIGRAGVDVGFDATFPGA